MSKQPTPDEFLLQTSAREKWGKIGLGRRSGILVALFSVYSQQSLGIGEFADLKLLVDWCRKTGNSIIQLLPLNPVSFTFCPYDALSSFALEPAYLSLRLIPGLERSSIRGKIELIKKSFPRGRPYVDYRVKAEKIRILREFYLKEKIPDCADFQQFKTKNAYWLEDFAVFMALKDYHAGKPWYEWEAGYRERERRLLDRFTQEHHAEINFQIWLQWQLYRQLKAVKEYAIKNKVLLEGDLPILVSRDSADVWSRREFFKLELAAGAPPDMYCAKGQRWDMPTYNWGKIRSDEFGYLKEKLKYAQNFYDLLRIDHVLGIFRIWSIAYGEPRENQGLNGVFDPPEEKNWVGQGKEVLSVMLANSDMLLCAEDLGVIPKGCPETLEKLGIPGNDVQRWVKDWKVRHDFLKPQDYRLFSVAMLSTHDTTNWAAWWENEAGTIDETLFKRRCSQYRIEYAHVKEKLFDPALSRYGRLRWLKSITSTEIFLQLLSKGKEEAADLIDLYKNSFAEKEKLWQHLQLAGPVREKADREIVRQALKLSLETKSIFVINTLIDWLYLGEIFPGDPYQVRMNTPGTISEKNWSVVMPLSLEELLRHKINKEIRALIVSAYRTGP